MLKGINTLRRKNTKTRRLSVEGGQECYLGAASLWSGATEVMKHELHH